MTTKHDKTIEQCTNAIKSYSHLTGHGYAKQVLEKANEESAPKTKEQYLARKAEIIASIKKEASEVRELRAWKDELKAQGKGVETASYSHQRLAHRQDSCVSHLQLAILKRASALRYIESKQAQAIAA